MSAEVVKKRGRPKKVISDPIEVELPDIKKKSTTRAKSTKTVPKATKTPSTTSAKTTVPKPSVSKPIGSSATPQTIPKVPSEPPKVVKQASSPQSNSKIPDPPGKFDMTAKAALPASKILEQVRELEAKNATSSQTAQASRTTEAASKTVPPAAKSSSIPPPNKSTGTSTLASEMKAPASKPPPSTKTATSPPPSPPKSAAQPPLKPSASPFPLPPPKPATKPHVPLAALNSEIVSNISARAGARPNAAGTKQLPNNYKSVARRVTMTIVALPIAIVTSYVLYQRLVLGEEPKKLVPELFKEAPKAEASKTDVPSSSVSSS